MQSVVIVDPFSSGALYAPLLKERGYAVLAVLSEPAPPPFLLKSYRPEDFQGASSYNGDLKRLAEEIIQGLGSTPIAIIPGAESGVLLAEELAEFWQLPSNPQKTSALRRNKFLMNEHLKNYAIPAVQQKLCSSKEDAFLFYQTLQQQAEKNNRVQMVLKPIDSCATDGVRLVSNLGEIEDYFQQYQGKLNILGHAIKQILAQEYLEGIEFVVDSVSCTGANGKPQHFVTNLCRYKKESANNSNFVYREMAFVDPNEYPDILAYTEQILAALDFRCGASHCELMLTKQGPILIEIAGRIHGGFGPKIVEQSSSHCLLNLTLDSYLAPDAWLLKTKNKASLKCHALEHFFISRQSGKIKIVNFQKEIQLLPSYYYGVWNVTAGKMLSKTTDLANAPCWIILLHEDLAQVRKDQEFLLELEKDSKIFTLELQLAVCQKYFVRLIKMILNTHNRGVIWVLLYVIFTAIQGVWLAAFLQRVDFFATLFINFALAMIFFHLLFLLKKGNIISLIKSCGQKNIAILNVLTCINWLSYFAALKFIEPAVEAAIGSAVPAIVTLLVLYLQGNRNFNYHNFLAVAIIFIGGSILVFASFKGLSAIGHKSASQIIFSVLMAIVTGISIACYTIFSKYLNQKKITAQGIMVLRFPLLLLISAILAPKGAILTTFELNWAILPAITAIGVILPIFFLQVGIAHSSPLVVAILITILPLFFYTIQFFDPRLEQSAVSIAGIVVVTTGIMQGMLLGKRGQLSILLLQTAWNQPSA